MTRAQKAKEADSAKPLLTNDMELEKLNEERTRIEKKSFHRKKRDRCNAGNKIITLLAKRLHQMSKPKITKTLFTPEIRKDNIAYVVTSNLKSLDVNTEEVLRNKNISPDKHLAKNKIEVLNLNNNEKPFILYRYSATTGKTGIAKLFDILKNI